MRALRAPFGVGLIRLRDWSPVVVMAATLPLPVRLAANCTVRIVQLGFWLSSLKGMTMSKTFLITGVSTGLGRAFAQAALDAGHTVTGTVRIPAQVSEFEALAPGRARGLVLDIT